MKRHWNIRFLVVLGLVFHSCATVHNITVSNVNDPGALQKGSFIYALPQTVIDVCVTMQKISILPGPYEKYAHKYLGIQETPARAETQYNITGISLQKHVEADPDFMFTMQGVIDPSQFSGLSNLIRDNLIVQAADFSADQVYLHSNPSVPEGPAYTDLSVKRNFIAEKDVEVSKVMPDSNFVTRPAGKTLLKEKTLEQKAEEAANFLIKLKKRRFKLISGQYANMPGGEAISDALQELSKLEEEYLSLFIGKKTITEMQRIFHYTPVAGRSPDRFVICRFSSDKGLLDAREALGIPVILELEAMHKTKELEIFKLPLKPSLNAIPYRIADQAQIKILAGEQLWAEANFPVFQYGVNVTMNPNQ